ncbi:hypothetical protein ACOMHN_049514 [Nucella lapillus]
MRRWGRFMDHSERAELVDPACQTVGDGSAILAPDDKDRLASNDSIRTVAHFISLTFNQAAFPTGDVVIFSL